jgi:hypothetical protein
MPKFYSKNKQSRDANHSEIVQHLQRNGIEVIETFQPLDILIYKSGIAGWIEIKTESRNAGIRRSQIKFMAETKMPVAFVKTPAEAYRFASTFEGLTAKEKANLAEFLKHATNEKYYPATIERVLAW